MIPADITDLYITTGPGSFTGCRINTLIAKAWATTDNVKVHAIDSLAFQAGNKECLSLIDAKGNKCYYLLNEAKQKKIGIVPLNEIHQLNKHHLPIVIDFKNVDIVNNLRECYKHFKIVDVKKLTPLYIKPAI
jgi:tRNA A37 threonylcarbamoyladenosine modification protein TsaB